MSNKLGLRKRWARLFSGAPVTSDETARVCARMAKRMTAFPSLPELGDKHCLVVGGTRKGKSGLLELFLRALLARREGATGIDPHGSFVRSVRDWCANPSNGQFGRSIHFLDPAGATTFGLNVLRTYDTSWEACHDAAVTLASVIESRFEASPEETPRLSRIVYIGSMLCARHGLTVLELIELLSIGGETLRRSLLDDFDNRIVRNDLEDLHFMASRRPSEFLGQVESTKNRFVRWCGDRRLARILGQKRGLDPLAVMNNGEVVLADFSSLTYSDAAFLGCLMTSMYFAAARRRSTVNPAPHRMILDEAESLLTIDVARMCDQSAKAGLFLGAAAQRLGQLRARGDFIADALLTNCAVKICFGGLELESARYMAESLHVGHIDMQSFKPASVRPVAVGNQRVIVRNRSRAQHHGEHTGTGVSDIRSSGSMAARSQTDTLAWASGFSDGSNSAFVSTPPDPLLGGPPSPLSQSAGRSRGRNLTSSGGSSNARSAAHHSARARATSTMRASSDGTSIAEGESESYVTRFADLPTEFFSLEEQLHKATAALVNLPRRECYVKVENQPPYKMRTPDLSPPFKTAAFKDEMLPRFMQQAAERSRFLVRADQVDAEIAARAAGIFVEREPKPEPDLAAGEPIPTVVDRPQGYARGFWQRAGDAGQGASPIRPPGDTSPLRIIKGGKDDVDNTP